jgi:hypothetical protein
MGRNSWFFYCFFSVFSKKNIPQTVEKSLIFFDPKIEKKGSVFDENPQIVHQTSRAYESKIGSKIGPEEKRII